jgi:hypothetical protein
VGRIACVFAGCLVGFLLVPPRPASAPERAVRARPADFVTVDHRFVTVEAAPVRGMHAASRVAQKPPRVTRTATVRPPLLARAKQLVLGDGQARPEPFPRPAVR